MKNFLKYCIALFIVLLTVGTSVICISAAQTDELKILAIGNSFSEDATEYLAFIATDLGIEKLIVGNAYIGGCSIATHADNARNNTADYRYDKNAVKTVMSNAQKTNSVTLDSILCDEEWDIVTLQQSSPNSGKAGTYNGDIDYLVDYVKERCPNAKLAWHMTWSYQSDYTASSFKYYDNDQIKMYNMICDAVQKTIVKNGKFDYIIPAGTAIQNARTTEKGDTFTRDGIHLDLNIGRYIVGVTWFKTFGYSIDNLKTLPSRVRKTDLPMIKEVVESAVASPFNITKYGEPKVTAPQTDAKTTAPETETETGEPQQQKGNGSNSAVIITIVCAVAVFAIGATVGFIIFKKRR